MNDAQTTEKRLRILLADRSSEVLGLISNILESGFEIVAAVHDSQSLLAMDGTTEHDLLVADILLPGISGIEQWKNIHRPGLQPNSPSASIQNRGRFYWFTGIPFPQTESRSAQSPLMKSASYQAQFL